MECIANFCIIFPIFYYGSFEKLYQLTNKQIKQFDNTIEIFAKLSHTGSVLKEFIHSFIH